MGLKTSVVLKLHSKNVLFQCTHQDSMEGTFSHFSISLCNISVSSLQYKRI